MVEPSSQPEPEAGAEGTAAAWEGGRGGGSKGNGMGDDVAVMGADMVWGPGQPRRNLMVGAGWRPSVVDVV